MHPCQLLLLALRSDSTPIIKVMLGHELLVLDAPPNGPSRPELVRQVLSATALNWPRQGRAAPQRFEVDQFVIGCPRLPTSIQDADPLEGQRPHGGLVGCSLGC